MITGLLVLLGLLAVAVVCWWLTVVHEEREHQRRELHRRLIAQAAEQQMRAIDRAVLSAMFEAVRGRGPS